MGDVELWGSSVHMHRERWSMKAETVPVQPSKAYLAARAIFFGATQKRMRARDDSERWQARWAVPIELADNPWRQLIVGAITISSTKDYRESGLAEANEAALVRHLHEHGEQLLDPGRGSPRPASMATGTGPEQP
jgi:hypothetical protein